MTPSRSEGHVEQAPEALRNAVANALEHKRRVGQYAMVWRDGQTFRLAPEQLCSAGYYLSGAPTSPATVSEPEPDDDEDPK